MNIQNINKLRAKAINEAQKEVNKIFDKYSKLIVDDIANQIPKGHKLLNGNGLCILMDADDKELSRGNAWSITGKSSPKMDKIALLQYGVDKDDLQGCFTIPTFIEGNQ